MQLAHVKELEKKYVLGTYARYDVLVERGSGAYLIDKSNKRYLDLLTGIGVNALGYNHPRVKQLLRKQIKRPIHVSNLFYHDYQGRLARSSVRFLVWIVHFSRIAARNPSKAA
jgi:acetylornithine aminotransferase/acetylornithine/N-succinyldiaminopimelate aminotransferase